MPLYIPRDWRLQKVVWALLILEFPFTVANLTLFGIAAPNTYRTLLWAEGGKQGFNSDPSTILYAYANYRPVKEPLVWSNFNTQYNLVIGVLSMFFYLTKCTLWIMHILYPVLSLPLHLALTGLWAYSIYVQTAPDTIDPERQNHGAPWYITKSCSVSSSDRIKGYCEQAKSAFAVSVVMLAIMAILSVLSLLSLFPSKASREAHAHRVAARKAEQEKFAPSPYDNEMTAEEQWQHMWELQQLPRTPGTTGGMRSPTTPRTTAFNALDGGFGFTHAHQPAPSEYYRSDIERSPVSPVNEYYDAEGKGKAIAL